MEILITLAQKLPIVRSLVEKARAEAFKLAHQDFMSTMDEEIDRRAEILSEKKLANLLSVVDWSQVLSKDSRTGVYYLATEPIDNASLANLKSEANLIADTELWKILIETPKALAHKAMFIAGESIDDMKKGRAILHTLSSQETVIDLLRG